MYELCFPGAITGETEVDCPYCGTQLTVTVEDPMGKQAFSVVSVQGYLRLILVRALCVMRWKAELRLLALIFVRYYRNSCLNNT